VALFRRREPLHRLLAREGGEGKPLPHDPGPHWGEVGIHGLARPREWDAVASVEAPELRGDEATFVALPDGSLLIEEGDTELDATPLADALEQRLQPPYRARAVRRRGGVWAVAGTAIEVVELADEPGGDELELVWDGAERTVRIDGAVTPRGLPTLERIGAERHAAYVVRASRLEGTSWEVWVAPL
jgi:hypothetical protein